MAFDRIGRMTRSRLQLIYNLQHDHGTESVEVPFVLGVLAPLAAESELIKPYAERRWKLIDRDTFDDVLAQFRPRLTLRLRSLMPEGQELTAKLEFRSIEDFDPPQLAKQLPMLGHLAEDRKAIGELLQKILYDDDFRQQFEPLAENEAAAEAFLSQTPTPFSDDTLDYYRSKYRLPNRATTARTLTALRAMITLSRQADPMGLMTTLEAKLRLCESRCEGLLGEVLREVLHAMEFRQLEAAWRGLFHLVRNTQTSSSLKIKVLPISRVELDADLARPVSERILVQHLLRDDRSGIGPEPIGMLLADFGFTANDAPLLRALGEVTRHCHCPVVANVAPGFFHISSFRELEKFRDPRVVGVDWDEARQAEEFRQVALTLPRMLCRKPWGEQHNPCEGLAFEEFPQGVDPDLLPWTNTAWAYAQCILEAFCRDGWFTNVRGVQSGGKVDNWPKFTDRRPEGSTLWLSECLISDRLEEQLTDMGLLAFVPMKTMDFGAFLATCSTARVLQCGPDPEQSLLLSRWPYHLCAARFAVVLRQIVRDARLDLPSQGPQVAELLTRWLSVYCDPEGRTPLLAGQVAWEQEQLVVSLQVNWPGDTASRRTWVKTPITT